MKISYLAKQAAQTAKLQANHVVVAGAGRDCHQIRIDTLTLESFTSVMLQDRLSQDIDIHIPLLANFPDLVGICLVAFTAGQERQFITSMIGARQAFGLQGMWLDDPLITTPQYDAVRTIALGKAN